MNANKSEALKLFNSGDTLDMDCRSTTLALYMVQYQDNFSLISRAEDPWPGVSHQGAGESISAKKSKPFLWNTTLSLSVEHLISTREKTVNMLLYQALHSRCFLAAPKFVQFSSPINFFRPKSRSSKYRLADNFLNKFRVTKFYEILAALPLNWWPEIAWLANL